MTGFAPVDDESIETLRVVLVLNMATWAMVDLDRMVVPLAPGTSFWLELGTDGGAPVILQWAVPTYLSRSNILYSSPITPISKYSVQDGVRETR